LLTLFNMMLQIDAEGLTALLSPAPSSLCFSSAELLSRSGRTNTSLLAAPVLVVVCRLLLIEEGAPPLALSMAEGV
jgi:hypothetical protein